MGLWVPAVPYGALFSNNPVSESKNWCEARGQKKPRIKTAHRFNTWGLSSNNQNVANEHQTIRKGTGSIQQLRFDSHKKHRFKTFRINQTGTWTFLKLLWDPKITVFFGWQWAWVSMGIPQNPPSHPRPGLRGIWYSDDMHTHKYPQRNIM